MTDAKRLAYADPPYLGCCDRYDHEHNNDGERSWDGRCWDDPETHRLLFADLDANYDGWAYSMTSVSLATLLPMVPHARVGAWVKPFASFKKNVRICYAWEPILFVPARHSQQEGVPYGRDFIAESITLRRGFTGTKPERVCRCCWCTLDTFEWRTTEAAAQADLDQHVAGRQWKPQTP